ncbi:HAMP domain-containing histidine kinase, partial [bacterium]|nr:HAMP domain-containing histidine kinase [bacterium]
MSRILKHFRLALVLLVIIYLMSQQWGINMLLDTYKLYYSKEVNYHILERETTFKNWILMFLDKSFMEIDKDISSQLTNDVEWKEFIEWFKNYASGKPLVGGGFIWSRNDDNLITIPISVNIDSSQISLVRQYLYTKFDSRYEDHPYPIWHRSYLDSTRKLINTHIGFTLYNDKYSPEELRLYRRYKGIDKIFGVVWNNDEFKDKLLPEQMRYIETYAEETGIYLRGFPFDWLNTEYNGILITDVQGDTIYHLGKVQLEPNPNLDDVYNDLKPKGWSMKRTPNWRIYVQNYNLHEFAASNRWNYRQHSSDSFQEIRQILYDIAVSDRSNTILSWIFIVVSLGFLFFLILFQIKARERQRNFIAHISHELRTPISKVKLFAETLRNDRTISEEKEDEYLDNILHASDHLSVLVNNTLNLARLDTGKFSVTPTYGDVGDWLESFYQSHKGIIANSGFKSELKIEPDLPKVSFDPEAMELAFRNIIDNAVKYSEEQKEIEISARRKDDRMVILSVSDRGIGIPKKKCKAVFRRFCR